MKVGDRTIKIGAVQIPGTKPYRSRGMPSRAVNTRFWLWLASVQDAFPTKMGKATSIVGRRSRWAKVHLWGVGLERLFYSFLGGASSTLRKGGDVGAVFLLFLFFLVKAQLWVRGVCVCVVLFPCDAQRKYPDTKRPTFPTPDTRRVHLASALRPARGFSPNFRVLSAFQMFFWGKPAPQSFQRERSGEFLALSPPKKGSTSRESRLARGSPSQK